jgi:hypothetical protein
MKKLLLGLMLGLPLLFTTPASALPGSGIASTVIDSVFSSDIVEIKGGRGGGRGGGWGRGGRGKHYGWSRGRGHHKGFYRGRHRGWR